MKTEIQSRADLRELVKAFYIKVQADPLIGPVFNHMLVSPEVWAHHEEKLTDFWDSILFGSQNYTGNPIQQHVWVDYQVNYRVTSAHFERWLALWEESLDERFFGFRTDRLKNSARNMGNTFHEKIMEVRQKLGK